MVKECKVCKQETTNPKYCSLACRGKDPDYVSALRKSASGKVISAEQRKKLSDATTRWHRNNPRPKKDNLKFSEYKWAASFKFALSDYPNRFDFGLIEQFGWYAAANKGNNLGGVSRDHMVSVKYGFENNIPPEHIAHPANCCLVRHNENAAKNAKCNITYEELLHRIEHWGQ